MNIELAKRLKAAGYPQNTTHLYYSALSGIRMSGHNVQRGHSGTWDMPNSDELLATHIRGME